MAIPGVGAYGDSGNPNYGKGGNVGATSTLPRPNLPGDVCPVPYPLPDYVYAIDGSQSGLGDYLAKLLQAHTSNPQDPVALQNLMDFIAAVQKKFNGNPPPELMKALGSADVASMIKQAVTQGAMLALFAGYKGISDPKEAYETYIKDTLEVLKGIPHQSGDYIDQMIQQSQTLLNNMDQFFKDHIAQTDNPPKWKAGDLIWDDSKGSGRVYNWSNTDDRKVIMTFILGTTAPGPVTDVNDLLRMVRVQALANILKLMPDDAIQAVMMWLATNQDTSFQTTQRSYQQTTDMLTDLTNSIFNQLVTLGKGIGTDSSGKPIMTMDQFQKFIGLIQNASVYFSLSPQFANIAPDFNNYLKTLKSIQIDSQTTFGDIMNNPTQDNLLRLCKTNPAAPTNPNPDNPFPTPNPAFTQISQSLQQMGGLVTSTSSTISMQLSAVGEQWQQWIQVIGTVMQDLAALRKAFVSGQNVR